MTFHEHMKKTKNVDPKDDIPHTQVTSKMNVTTKSTSLCKNRTARTNLTIEPFHESAILVSKNTSISWRLVSIYMWSINVHFENTRRRLWQKNYGKSYYYNCFSNRHSSNYEYPQPHLYLWTKDNDPYQYGVQLWVYYSLVTTH